MNNDYAKKRAFVRIDEQLGVTIDPLYGAAFLFRQHPILLVGFSETCRGVLSRQFIQPRLIPGLIQSKATQVSHHASAFSFV